MKYTVYQIICDRSSKLYVGYTSKGMLHRFNKHCSNSNAGMTTHLYNAMRKYGIENFSVKKLWEGESKEKAVEMERHYISLFNTFVEGYNQTLGGDGGITIDDTNRDEWIRKKKLAASGKKNSRYIAVSDEELLEKAYEFFEERGSIPLKQWLDYSGDNGLPKSYTKFRFSVYGGGRNGFKTAMMEKYKLDEENFKYTQTQEHKQKLSMANKGKRRWD
tara:strand:- start:140 stop:793 length:654 start_codon:yes stop_codon:yes gene_type:complete